MTLRTELAVTRGKKPIVHRRFPLSPMTVCGQRVLRAAAGRESRGECDRCVRFLR